MWDVVAAAAAATAASDVDWIHPAATGAIRCVREASDH